MLNSTTLGGNEHRSDFKQAETQVELGECECNGQKRSFKNNLQTTIGEWMGG